VLAAAGVLALFSSVTASAGPSSWLAINGVIRFAGGTATYGWANSGTPLPTNTCPSGAVNLAGSGGIFNCGAPNGTAPPSPPSLTPTAAADPSIVASAFIADALFNSTHKDTGLICPVTGATTTAGDPTALTTGASKNDLDLNGFLYTPTSLQPKDDLGNVYGVSHQTGSTNELFFGAERVINNGASHIDFEFLQQPLTLVPASPTACNGTFSGHRSQGDILAVVDFSTGGSFAGNSIWQWQCGTTLPNPTGFICDPGTSFPNAEYVKTTGAPANAFLLGVNQGAAPIPCGGWVCRDEMQSNSALVSQNEFMEGGVNLNDLGFTGCVQTMFPHTRSSPDINSTLQDFAGPIGFNTCKITTTPGAPVTDLRGGAITDAATVSGFIGTPGTVNFKLYGPFASSGAITSTSCVTPVFTSGAVTTTDTGSPAHYSTSFTPTSVGVYQWVASYTSPNGTVPAASGTCGDRSELVTVVDANIQISPLTKANEIGTPHTLTGHVNVSSGTSYVNAPAGTSISFSILSGPGSLSAPSCATVLATGSCSVTLTSSTPGITVVRASTTVTVAGLPISRSTGDANPGDSADASKRWVDANISISPPTAFNEIGATHTLTGHVNVNDGSGGGYVSAPAGTTITFSIVSGPGSLSAPSCATLLATGSCSVTLSSATPGVTVLNASTTVVVNGVTLTRATGDAHSGDSFNATKNWEDANIQISPLTAFNEIGATHTLTGHVNVNDGTGYVNAAAGTVINFSVVSGPGALSAPSCATALLTGSCSVTLSSGIPGERRHQRAAQRGDPHPGHRGRQGG
jgi:hypothetical protein